MIKLNVFLYTCFVLLAFQIAAHGQVSDNFNAVAVKFDRLSIEQGLSQSTVRAIHQDPKGFMWFGTLDGLNRYDGYAFVAYKKSITNSNTISDNEIKVINSDPDGNLWVGTGNGLNHFNPITGLFTRYYNDTNNPKSLPGNDIVSIVVTDTHIWVGTNSSGVARAALNKQPLEFETYNYQPDNTKALPNNNIGYIYQDNEKNIWIGTNKGLSKYLPAENAFQNIFFDDKTDPVAANNISSIVEDRQGFLWLASKLGVHRYNKKTGEIKTYRHQEGNPRSLSFDIVISVMQDQSGNIWIGTGNGLNVYNPRQDNFHVFLASEGDAKSLSKNNIASLYEDRSGIVWIGTWEGGLNKYDRMSQKFSLYKSESNRPDGLGAYTIRSLMADKAGFVWIGTIEGGLYIYDRKNDAYKNYQQDVNNPYSLNENTVTAFCEDSNGDVWVGTWEAGLNKVIWSNPSANDVSTKGIKGFVHYKHNTLDANSLSSDTIQAIVEVSPGYLLINTSRGVTLFDTKNNKFQRWKERQNMQGGIAIDKQGNWWFTSWDGLCKIKPNPLETIIKTGQFGEFTVFYNKPEDTTSLSDTRVISVMADSKDNIWVGTFGGGLNKMIAHQNTNGQTEYSCKRYRKEQGLPNDVVYRIHEDESGNIWASTNKGISKLNTQSEVFSNYDVNHGLQSNEFFWGASCKSANGELFFGGIKGFNSFYPAEVKDNPYIPPVVITDFKLLNKSVSIGDERLPQHICYTNELTLGYDDKVLSFDFSSLHYSSPQNNLYAYKLEGFDKEWVFTDASRRFVTYTNLDPGTYVFHVRGSNSDGKWNADGTTIKITIKPPFWETWWFRLFSIALVVFSVWYWYRARTRRLELQKRALERLVKERTVEVEQQKEEILAQKDLLEQQNEQIKHQRDYVEEQNHQITGSIRYAQTIQKAILPSDDNIAKFFEHFLIYKPKDIVSGDFYWMSYNPDQYSEKIFLAVVDCTGHGVPGAFMSMIGSRLLNEIVNERKIYQPSQILHTLNIEIKNALKQTETDNNDGMDVALCLIERNQERELGSNDKSFTRVTFAGAKRPLYYFSSEKNEVLKFEGNRKSIGGVKLRHDNVTFEDDEVYLRKGDLFYLMSDGFIDQNSPERKRFGSPRFEEMLKKHINTPLPEQKTIFLKALVDYQQNHEQRDDITLIGVKI